MKNWSVIGLNEFDSHVEIESLEYTMPKKDAALIQAIMCLVDSVKDVAEELGSLTHEISMK